MNKEFDKMGIDVDSQEFIDALSYVQRDCYVDPIMMLLEEVNYES